MKASSSSSATGIHRFSWWSNSNSVPSDSWTAMNLLSSLENEMRSSFSNSAGSVGKVKTSATDCSAILLRIVGLRRGTSRRRSPQGGHEGRRQRCLESSSTKVPSSPKFPGQKDAAGVGMPSSRTGLPTSHLTVPAYIVAAALGAHSAYCYLPGQTDCNSSWSCDVQQALCSSNELHDT